MKNLKKSLAIKKLILIITIAFMCSSCCSIYNINCPETTAVNQNNQYYFHNLEINGFPRKAKIYIPNNITVASPVIFYFHGYSGHIEDSDTRRHFQTYWPEAIIVYAEGRYPYSNTQSEAGWRIRFPYINQVCGESEDLEYIDEIMVHLISTYLIDPDKIFASGHSSGAFFTLALMELRPELFKGFAMLGAYSRFSVNASNVDCNNDATWTGGMPLTLNSNEHAAIPRPVLYMFGNFENFDYDGPPDAMRSYSSSCNETSRFRKTVDELLIRNRCDIPSCDNIRRDYIKIDTRQTFQPNSSLGAETQIWLYGGGHGWEELPDANQIVIDYFKSL